MDLSEFELPHMYLKHLRYLKQRIRQTMEQGVQTILTESVCVSTNACLGLCLTSAKEPSISLMSSWLEPELKVSHAYGTRGIANFFLKALPLRSASS